MRDIFAKLRIKTTKTDNHGRTGLPPSPQTPEVPRANGYVFTSPSALTVVSLDSLAPPPPGPSHHVQPRPALTASETTTSSRPEAGIETNEPSSTCSLNLVCYRAGRHGCVLEQVRVAKRGYKPEACSKYDVTIIRDDEQFFRVVRETYTKKMCSVWRRYLSLKNLRKIRLLSYAPATIPEVVHTNTFALQEILHTYKNPPTNPKETQWIEWVFKLRQPGRRHALEFVEGWSSTRIAIIGSVPWVVATAVGVWWAIYLKDTQTAFTVAAYILSAGTFMLALLAIVSNLD